MESIHVVMKNVLLGMVKDFNNVRVLKQYNYQLNKNDFDGFGAKIYEMIEKYESLGMKRVTSKMLENEGIREVDFQDYFRDCKHEENFVLYAEEVQAFKGKQAFEILMEDMKSIYQKVEGNDIFKKTDDFISLVHHRVNQLKPLKKGIEGFTMLDLHKQFKTFQNNKKPIPSGFKEVDHIMGGWKRSGINILTGPSNHGKSTVAFNAILNAVLSGYRVKLLNLELEENDVYSKMMGLVSEEASKEHHLSSYDLSNPVEVEKHEERAKDDSLLVKEFFGDKLLVKTGTFTDEMIYNELYDCESQGYDLMIVDYFQLVEVGGEGKIKTQKLSELQEKVRNIVRKCSFAFLWLAQLKEDTSKDNEGNLKIHPMEYEITWCRDLYKGADMEVRIWRDYENIQLKTFTDYIHFGFTKSRSFGRTKEPITMIFDGERGYIGEKRKLKSLFEIKRENPYAEDEFYDDYSDDDSVFTKDEMEYNLIESMKIKQKQMQVKRQTEEENIEKQQEKLLKEIEEMEIELEQDSMPFDLDF